VEPDPLARKDGFDGGAGRFEELPGAWRVAMAVGKTKEGESFPANLGREVSQEPGGPSKDASVVCYPIFVYPVPLSMTAAS
jgi:hypothetical protein